MVSTVDNHTYLCYSSILKRKNKSYENKSTKHIAATSYTLVSEIKTRASEQIQLSFICIFHFFPESTDLELHVEKKTCNIDFQGLLPLSEGRREWIALDNLFVYRKLLYHANS